jgi:hypothetical protein
VADIDLSDIEAFARDLDSAPAQAVLGVRKVVRKGAQNVKDRLRREASGVSHAPALPRDITYDVELQGDDVVAEIGPLTKAGGGTGAGSLALLYLGNSRTGPRLPEPMLAADAEAEVVADLLADMGLDALGDG